jgi:hypothetical protein
MADTGTGWTGSDWASVIGSLAQAGGAYFGAQYGQAQPGQVSGLGPKESAWAQLMGLSTIGQFAPTLQAGNQALVQGYGNAAQLQGLLPGLAQQGTQAQLGQVAGAETGAIQHVLKNQQAQLGQVGQQGASQGFYGSSAQQGVQGQVFAQTNQSIADIMAGTASTKANIIGQGVGAQMAGITAAAQGQAALGEAFAKASGAEYNLMKDKLNTILATGNAWGIGDWELRNLQRLGGGLPAAGQNNAAYSFGPGQGFGASPKFQSGDIKTQNWAQAFGPWADYAQGFLSNLWG